MTVLTQGIGEGDFELQRYGDCRIGVNWKEDLGGYYAPKDFTGWSFKLILDDEFGDQIYETTCTTASSGDVWGDIPASVLSDDTFDYCTRGRWRIVGTCAGKTELVGHGNYRVC